MKQSAKWTTGEKMAVSWEDLIAEFKQPELISHDSLYNYLVQKEVRDSLISLREVPGALEKRAVWSEVRRRSKADLFWLSHYFLWDKCPFNETGDIKDNLIRWETHKEMCELFVKKDDSKPIAKQDWRKDRLLLFPRGSAKSTVDGHDCVSWVLNFPFVRIGYMTAVSPLAEGFVSEIKGYFQADSDNPSLMSIFFPEFCFAEKKGGAANEFWCPVFVATGRKRKDPTILGLGAEASMSGWHFDILKGDDIVSTANSSNDEICRKTSRVFYINKKMLMAYGYCDLVGTRYHDVDLYSEIIERNLGEIKKSNPKPGVELTENLTTGQITLIGRALTIKDEAAKELEQKGKEISYKEAGPEGCHTLFPELLPYSKLMVDLNADEFAFESQMNQNPRPAGRTVFDRPLLDSCTVDYKSVPTVGPRVQFWDFSFSQKKKRDFCVCASAIFDQDSNCYIHDLIRDRFSPSNLAKAVVEMIRKWHPYSVGVENAGGSRLLEPAIISEAYKTGDQHVISVASRIDWVDVDKSADAKRTRMAALHPWLVEKRMLFANHLPFLDVLYSEFERCLTSSAHDDVPDCLSYLPRYLPKVRQLIASQYTSPMTREEAIAQATYNLVYGEWLTEDGYGADCYGNLGRSVPVPLEPEPEPETELLSISQIPGVESPLGAGLVA